MQAQNTIGALAGHASTAASPVVAGQARKNGPVDEGSMGQTMPAVPRVDPRVDVSQAWRFPLPKAIVRVTEDSASYAGVDLRTTVEIPLGQHVGAFGVRRRHHIHEGVDLYANEGDPVIAMEAGRVANVAPCTGPAAGFPWWLDTDMVIVEGARGVLVYGEIRAGAWRVGDTIKAGDVVGRITPVLRHDKGRPRCMLHLERYVQGVTASCGIWALDQPRPAGLLDPTPWLIEAAGSIRARSIVGR